MIQEGSPFDNLSGDPQQDYFVDGTTDGDRVRVNAPLDRCPDQYRGMGRKVRQQAERFDRDSGPDHRPPCSW